MKSLTKETLLISCLIIAVAAFSSPASAQIEIPTNTSVGTWDYINRIYTLTEDVSQTLKIVEDGLILDGNGHLVTGRGPGDGVFAESKSGVTIKNLTISQFYGGIRLIWCTNCTITNNNASSNDYEGIWLDRSSENDLIGNETSNNGRHGIWLTNSPSNNNTLSSNITSNNGGAGIWLSNANYNDLNNNTCNSNSVDGMWVGDSSNNNTLSNNTCNSNFYSGICLYSCSINNLTGNTVSENPAGIYVGYSNDNTLADNSSTDNSWYGIALLLASNNTLSGNIAENSWCGINLDNSTNNNLTDNIANSNNEWGIQLWRSDKNMLTGNTTSNNNKHGIAVAKSSNNTLTSNTMSGNIRNFVAGGDIDSHFDNDIDTTNIVDGKPIYYVKNAVGGVYDGSTNAGTFYAINCGNITIKDLTLTNNDYGIFFRNTHGSRIENTIATYNKWGIMLQQSNNNTLIGNTTSDNYAFGIGLDNSSDNEVYNNNFIDNTAQAHIKVGSDNVFNLDKPIGGNYWSDWTGPDVDGDGFVDSPYIFEGGQDDLPLVAIYTFTKEGSDVAVTPQDGETGTSPVTVTFQQVTESGGTSLIISDSGPEPPAGFELAGQYYNISTTAIYDGTIQVCIQYDDTGMSTEQENVLLLYHYDDTIGDWEDCTMSVDTENNIVCGTVTSLSLFAVFLDVAPPEICIGAPTQYGLYAAGALKLDFSAYDTVSGSLEYPALCGALQDPGGDIQIVDTGFVPGAGVYTLTVSAKDEAGNEAISEPVFFVVYDPEGGFVTGGGWIWSPTGAYLADPALEGKANFGFVSKYKKGAATPTGQTEFVFQAGDLNFHSSSYDWLVVTGSNYARFKGWGAINGDGDYRFMLWAGDSPDTFRIKIWWEEGEIENVIYDNGYEGSGYETGQPIDGGSIVIHEQ